MRNTTILMYARASRAFTTVLVACLIAVAMASSTSAGAASVVAHAARTVYLNEYANLKLISEGESSLNERGQGWGTFKGTVTAHLKLYPNQVNAVYTIYPKGGSVTGRASARYVIRGSTGYYGGTLTIIKGTGAYRHAAGTNLGISGTINRYSFALTVKAHGWIRY